MIGSIVFLWMCWSYVMNGNTWTVPQVMAALMGISIEVVIELTLAAIWADS
jgi:hypothetical protein